jgi:hypothetical protein
MTLVRDADRSGPQLALVFVLAVLAVGGCADPEQGPPAATYSQNSCPAPGVRIEADRGDAAAGYREMSLRVTNCGDRPFDVSGRPEIAVLGKDREPLRVDIVPSGHYPQSAHPVVLAPGQSTTAVMSWRNTVTDANVAPVSGVFLAVATGPGSPRQIVQPPAPLDLGNTGRLEVSVWL